MADEIQRPLSIRVLHEQAHACLGRQLHVISTKISHWNKEAECAMTQAFNNHGASTDDYEDFLIMRRQLNARLDMLKLLHKTGCYSNLALSKDIAGFISDFNAYAHFIRDSFAAFF